MDVELAKPAARADCPLIDVAPPAYVSVVRRQHAVEELVVDVVEPRPVLACEALRHERTEQLGQAALVVGELGRALVWRARDQDAIAGSELVEELPHEQRDAEHVDEAQDRVVVGAGERVALAGDHAQRRMISRVEDRGRVDRATQAIVHEQIEVTVAVGDKPIGEVGDAHAAVRSRDTRVPDHAVPHGGWRIVVDRAEVALAVDELVAHRELLRQTREGVVDRGVAVRVVVAHDVADDRRALAVRARRREAVLGHREQDAPVDGLQAVAHVGQRAPDDDGHRVVQVRRAHLGLERAGFDVAAGEHVDGGHRLHVQICDEAGVVFDELAARLDGVPHERREDAVGGRRVLDRHLRERPRRRVHRRVAQLRGVHLAKPLEALQRDALLRDREHGLAQRVERRGVGAGVAELDRERRAARRAR